MVSLNPRKQHYYIATFQLLLAAAFIVAIHSDCDVPPRFNFAELKEEYRHMKTFAAGHVVDYNCRPGYVKVLRSNLQCMRNSQWLGSREFCKAKSCSHPGDPENGRLVILTDLMFGATVNFTCEDGYRLIGSDQRKCVLEGSQVAWDRDIPYCQLIPCLPPPEIEHGRHTGMSLEEFNYGTSVTYQCDTVERGQISFSLIGEASIHCTSHDNVNGEWSGPAPECKAIHCQQPTVDHGKQVTGYSPIYTYNAFVMFECDSRYTLKGSNILKCNENNRWAPQLPVCERSSCDDPPHILNTLQNSSNSQLFPVGTVVKYDCKRGYELIPGISSAIVTCQKDFTWSEHQDFCQKMKCPYPYVNNGEERPKYGLRKETYMYGDHIKIQCNDGYILKNRYGGYSDRWSHGEWITCDHNGAWNRALPVCEPGNCDDPPHILNTLQNSSNSQLFPVGTVVKYDCKRGYELIPGISSAIVTCQKDFTWSEHQDFCQKMKCPYPYVNNGEERPKYGFRKETYMYGDRIKIQCNDGYILKNRYGGYSDRWSHGEWITCDHNGAWNRALPVCEPVCGIPPDIYDGWHYPQKKVFPVDSVVTYSCNKGWSLFGEPSTQCIGNCSNPPTFEYADRSNLREFLVGTRVTYSCKPGYTLIPGVSPSVTCLKNLTWSEVPELCQKIRCQKPVIENGKQVPTTETEYTYGSSVEFKCDSDYILKGNASINCDANGIWNPPIPSCIKVQCRKPVVQNGTKFVEDDDKVWYNMSESISFRCYSGYQFSGHWYLSATDSLNMTCLADGTWTVLPKCKKQSDAPVCRMVRETRKFLRCGVPLPELRMLLEVQKLHLEIQKLKRDLHKIK